MIACRMSVVSAEHLGIAQEIYAAVVADTSKSVHQSHDHDGKRTSSHKSRENQKKKLFRRDKLGADLNALRDCVKAVPRD